jgi:hypothetical protein
MLVFINCEGLKAVLLQHFPVVTLFLSRIPVSSSSFRRRKDSDLLLEKVKSLRENIISYNQYIIKALARCFPGGLIAFICDKRLILVQAEI